MRKGTGDIKTLWLWVVLALISASAFLSPRPCFAQDEEGPPPRMVRVHGVVRQPDGSSAAGLLVRFAPEHTGSPEATTDSGGRYAMEVDLRRPLWVETWVDGVVRSRYLRLAAPEGVTEIGVDIQLLPPIVMTGTITLPDGRPAADLTLKAEGHTMSESCGVAGAQGGGFAFDLRTDSSGRYTLPLGEGDQTNYDLYISEKGVGCVGPVRITTDIDRPNMRRDFHLAKGGDLRGTVVAAPDGAPLAGAVVSVGTGYVFHGNAFSRRDTSDEQGRFRFTTLPPGRYSLRVDFDEVPDEAVAPDVDEGLWAIFSVNPEAGEVEVTEGRTREVEIQMVKELVVTGRALGPDGLPLPQAALTGMDVVTDGDGRFAYRIRPRHSFYGEVALDREVTLAPCVSGIGVAIPVQVSFLEATPQEVDLRIVEPGALTVRASYQGTGRPVVGGCIRLSPNPAPPGPTEFLDDAGRFEITNVPPGEYQVSIREARILGCPTPPVSVTVHGGKTAALLELAFAPRPSFRGLVSGLPEIKDITLPEGGTGGFGLEVAMAPPGKPEEVGVVPIDLQPEGRFTACLPTSPTGRSDIVLKGGFPSPKLRVVSNVIRGVDLSGGGPEAGLQFQLQAGGKIGGRVVMADGTTPLPYAAVRARPLKGDALLLVTPSRWENEEPAVPEGHTDEEGLFTITGLLPGEYEVSVQWQCDCFGYVGPIYVALAEREQRTDLGFRAARDWP